MSIMVKSVNFDDYQKTQTNYKDTNFLQSAEMAKLQLSRNHIGEVEALVFERDGLIVGKPLSFTGGVFVSLGKHSYCMAPC